MMTFNRIFRASTREHDLVYTIQLAKSTYSVM
jgi:hypothetical protein